MHVFYEVFSIFSRFLTYFISQEKFNLLEIASKTGQAELESKSKKLQEDLTKQSALLWAEKDKIKRLQDNFVEVNSTSLCLS